MSCYKKDLFLILWGLNEKFYFMAENSDFARLYLRNWIDKYKMKGIFSLYKVDIKSFTGNNKEQISYIESVYEEDETIQQKKERYKQAAIEADKAKQIKLLFEGRIINDVTRQNN